MSATDDINSSKEEDDLLNEDLDNQNTGQACDDENNPVQKPSVKVDNPSGFSAPTAELTSKKTAEDNGKDCVDHITDILNKNIDNAESAKETITEKNKGDCLTPSEEITEKQVSSPAPAVETSLGNVLLVSKYAKTSDVKEDKLALIDDDIEEEDLRLTWDDDDGNDLSPEKQTKSIVTKDDEDVLGISDKLVCQVKSLENDQDLAETTADIEDNVLNSLETSSADGKIAEKDIETVKEKAAEVFIEKDAEVIKEIAETNLGRDAESNKHKDTESADTNIDKDAETNTGKGAETNAEKEAEMIAEEKLLEEDDAETTEVSEIEVSGASMEINEEELLKDDPVEETAMDIDTADDNVGDSFAVEKGTATADKTNKTENQLEQKAVEENLQEKDKPNSPLQEKEIKSEICEMDQQEQDVDNLDSVFEQNKEVNVQVSNASNIIKEENLMDIDKSMNTSIDSPIDIKTDHGLHKPDCMLEIPTQELIDIDDVLDSPDASKIDNDGNVNGSKDDDHGINDSILNDDEATEGTDSKEEEMKNPLEEEPSKIDEGNVEKVPSEVPTLSIVAPIEDPQPSTSAATSTQMVPDTSDELPEMSDSLGLLAESFRVVDEEEEQDDDDDHEGDDDDDSDLDESSNQMTNEHSEDSNPQNSETDQAKDDQEKEADNAMEEREDDMFNKCEEDFEYTLNDVGNEEQNEEYKTDEMSGEENRIEGKTEDLNAQEKKEVKTENSKTEVAGEVENLEPLLPNLKTPSEQEVKVKQEDAPKVIGKKETTGTDGNKQKETTDTNVKKLKEIAAAKIKKDRDSKVSRQSSTTSNDDVIEQIDEIETVKLSDDEDEATDKVDQLADKQTDGQTEGTEKTIEDQEKTEELHSNSSPAMDTAKLSPRSSPAKLRDLSVSNVPNNAILNIVDLEESSSEDDIQEVKKDSLLKKLLVTESPTKEADDVTSVNIPTSIDIMSASAGQTSDMVVKEGEVIISGLPKPPPHKPARLNTSEVTIKTASPSEQTLVIPEAKINEQGQPETRSKLKLSLEIFSLDSDEEDTSTKAPSQDPAPKKRKRCINSSCSSGSVALSHADSTTAVYYDAHRKRRPLVCGPCAQAVKDRQQSLIAGIKDMTPLLQLDMSSVAQDLVEILDSESEDEETPQTDDKDQIGEEDAEFWEKNLAEYLNKAWHTHNLDDRLKETEDELNAELQKLETASKEIDSMLSECQRVTDKLRTDLYATFEHRIHNLPPILIYETPEFNYIGPEVDSALPPTVSDAQARIAAKRKSSSNMEAPPKRAAIALPYGTLSDNTHKTQDSKTVDLRAADDDKDISVVKLSAESAPADLPPPGTLSRAPLRPGMAVYAMRNAFGPWFKGRIQEILPKSPNVIYTSCRVKFDHKVKNSGKVLSARCIAYAEPSDVRLTIGTRLIALFKDSNKKESFYSGIVAEIPNPVNNYRYLVFFDDGYAQYVSHAHTRVVCECSALVWEEVHPFSREFVREYLMAYPERPMVRLHEGQFLKTEWDGKWWPSRVAAVDASLAQVVFTHDGRREWVYRGSTRLAPLYLELRAAERHRPRPVPRSKHARSDMPYVEYTRSDEPPSARQNTTSTTPNTTTNTSATPHSEEIRRQRAVAKKSTALPSAPAHPQQDTVTSRVVYYTPKNAVKPYKLVPHKCSPNCKRSDVLSLKELRTYNPLAKPLLSGWERQIVRFKGQKEVMYRAPCGRRLRNMRELHRYLRATDSDLPVDLFDFYHATHCLAEFVLNKCLVGKKDLSHGKENVPVPCVNYYDDSLPEFCSYNTERTPTSGVPLNLDPEFLCGCDCTDDCEDKSKCACWKMTLEGARTIGLDDNVGYQYKRLPEPLPSGIYECNSRCACRDTCLNRVAQHPLQLKLQVFKTLNRGWGIRALNDVPKGSFLCVYAGNLLTDATANLDGLNEGDEYLAELDYIEVVEQMKEGYEEDIPEADKKMIKENTKEEASAEEPSSSSEEDDNSSKTDKEDDDFRPGYIGLGVMEFNKRLRRRGKIKKEEKEKSEASKDADSKDKEKGGSDCITISDDEEVREPSCLAARAGMSAARAPRQRSVREMFGRDEACYIMDAKVQGNIGRYLNHSCSPNVFVQNVFVDTHDPRFPWVAFFALSHIKAGTELTWNYNYDVGSVPGKVLYCYCEAPNCRGRLL